MVHLGKLYSTSTYACIYIIFQYASMLSVCSGCDESHGSVFFPQVLLHKHSAALPCRHSSRDETNRLRVDLLKRLCISYLHSSFPLHWLWLAVSSVSAMECLGGSRRRELSGHPLLPALHVLCFLNKTANIGRLRDYEVVEAFGGCHPL